MNTFNRKALLLGTLLSSAMIAAPTHAQVEIGDGVDDEIVVTGSRIQRSQDFVANSPVATIEDVQFERLGIVNTEQLLNVLPQTVPGFTRTSNNPGDGTATVDLRGLGANRTLVLVNGRRAQPSRPDGVVDINTIPPALIESTEVLTGGASSVYGADAVSGVVNFILKDDFEGVEAQAGFEATDKGDAELLTLNFTVGGNFDGGRGNAVASVGYTDRSALFQGDRDFSTVALFDNADRSGLEPGGSSGVPGTSIFAGFDFGAPVGADAEIGEGPNVGLGIFNPNGTLRPFDLAGDENDFYNYAPVNFIQLPQERFSVYTKADYEINENFEVFVEGRFIQSEVPQQLAPTPAFQTATFSLDNNPFIDPASQQIISDAIGDGVDTDGDGIDDTATTLLRRRLEEVGPRIGSDNRNTFQITAGLRGEVTDAIDYEIFYSEGRTNNSSFQEGNINVGRFRQALLLAEDPDNPGNVDTSNVSCANPDSSGGTVPCAPLNIFGEGNISPEAAEFLRTAVSATDETLQRVLQGNISGELGEGTSLTDTPIGFAFGAEYIDNGFEFRPSQDLAAGTIVGFNGAPPTSGRFDVYSAYGELLIPLIEDVPFVQNLNLELAGRVSDFSTVGTVYNWKAGGDWAINDLIRIRGNYNTAVRAPNISELFAPRNEGFPGADDPCAADGGFVGDEAVRAVCEATGVPPGNVFSPALNPASGQVRALGGGNPDLDAETADTFTVGVVLSPNLFDGFTASVDYYNIDIEDVVAGLGGSADNILNTCLTDTVSGGVGSLFCDQITRRADGTIDFVSVGTANAAFLKTSGVDIALQANSNTDFLFDGALGDFFVNYLGTIVIENEFQAFEGDTVFDCAGRFGNSCGEPDPEYSHFVTAGFNTGFLTTQLTWQMLGGVDDGFDLDPSASEDDRPFVDSIGDEHYFDLSATADFNDSVALTLGVRNVLDNEPPIIGDNDEQANTYPSTYDVFGRTFFGSIRTSF